MGKIMKIKIKRKRKNESSPSSDLGIEKGPNQTNVVMPISTNSLLTFNIINNVKCW